MPALPRPRGPLTDHLVSVLAQQPGSAAGLEGAAAAAVVAADDVVRDDDVQLALYVLYELAYQGFDAVTDDWEWDVELLRARRVLERALDAVLRERVTAPQVPSPGGEAVAAALFVLTSQEGGPGLSRYVARSATLDQVRELLVHRSVYQLKEADPHTWAIPRLRSVPKAALVEIQSDEYGGGRPERMHSALFARTMRALDLDDTYGRYVDDVPAVTLAFVNTMSSFGLRRARRGAVAGHLAALEMTSSLPNRLYGNGLRRLGLGREATEYFDEHVEADAVHEQIAGRDLAGALAEQEPHLVPDILFGAAACLATDDWVSEHLLGSWRAGDSSLRVGLHAGA